MFKKMNGATMKKKIFSLAVILMAVVAVSCGQKKEKVVAENGDYYFATYADAKIKAEEHNRGMVLDFYTDW